MNANIQLLKQYVDENSQAAFSRLVEKHLNLAYSAAIACLGNEDQARDACQLTFLELSKKAAKLSDSVHLGSWVHTTARHFSKKIQRTEIRRQKREQRYVDDMNMQQHSEPDWSRLMPEIHEAIGKLNPTEREAILLRFFQQKSLAEVGATLGVSADAARMRLNRALERLNHQLARRGIASTAAALATALPAHAMATAPTGLATTISTSVLATAGTSIATTTLAGASIAIMKTKTVLISAAIATTAFTGTGVYLAALKADTEIAEPSVTAPAVRQKTLSTEPVAHSTETHEQAVIAAPATIPAEPEPLSLGIDPTHLQQARQAAGLLEMALPMMNSDMVKTAMTKKIENPSEKLRLRLSLEPEAAAIFDEVLSRHTETESQRLLDSMTEATETIGKLMEVDREGFVNFMALQSMQKAGELLSPSQEEYIRTYTEKMTALNTDMGSGINQEPRQWYEIDTVVESLNESLSEEQQQELATHVEELKIRKREETAYRRTNELANTLGLNEEDRTALYKYLHANPDATNDDIAEKLSPELRKLMPNATSPLSVFNGINQ